MEQPNCTNVLPALKSLIAKNPWNAISVMAENEVSHSKLPCHRCGKEFQTNWHLKRHSKTCSEKCQCYKEKTTKFGWSCLQLDSSQSSSWEIQAKSTECWRKSNHGYRIPTKLSDIDLALILDYDWYFYIHMDI